jgi:hypothetical protein
MLTDGARLLLCVYLLYKTVSCLMSYIVILHAAMHPMFITFKVYNDEV